MKRDILDVLSRNSLGMLPISRMLSELETPSFPPYNIITDDVENPSEYIVELAVAGFTRDELTIKINKTGSTPELVVVGEKKEADSRIYLTKGLASRSFTRKFLLHGDLQAKAVTLEDGVLTVYLTVVKPVEDVMQLTIQ